MTGHLLTDGQWELTAHLFPRPAETGQPHFDRRGSWTNGSAEDLAAGGDERPASSAPDRRSKMAEWRHLTFGSSRFVNRPSTPPFAN